MPIAKMKRLQVLALERDHDALLRQLERMGCVEISEPDAPDAPESLRRCDSETADCLARQRQVQTAIDALRRAAPPKKAPLLAPRPAIGEAEYLSETGLADGLALARQVNEAAGRLQQLTALAAGGSTYKLKYGHRGVNQPVRDLNGVRTYITSQNHGYAVDGDTVKLGKVRFVNANDGTCEGIDYPELKAFTVQFHPEACTGPKDTSFLFDQFVELMKGGRV